MEPLRPGPNKDISSWSAVRRNGVRGYTVSTNPTFAPKIMLCANPAVVILLGVYHMNLQVYENVLSHWSQVTRPMWGEGWRLFVNCKFFWRPIVKLLSIVNCQAAVSIVDKIVIRLSIFILLCIFVAPAALYTWHLSSTVYKGLTFWKYLYIVHFCLYIYT
jgi:hypothetical protein